jgi:leucyl aminopeptidase
MQIEFLSGPVLPTTSPIAYVVDTEALPAGLEAVVADGAKSSRFAGKAGQLHEAFVARDGASVRVALAGAGEAGSKDRSSALERAGTAITAKYLASGEAAVTIDFTGT